LPVGHGRGRKKFLAVIRAKFMFVLYEYMRQSRF
jgi:hypothetical protein